MNPSGILSSWLDAVVSVDHLHRLGLVVLHSVWQAVAVAAMLAVALRILPRRSAAAVQVRYVLAMLALVSLPVACIVTYAVIEPPRVRATAGDDAPQAATMTAPAAVILAGPSPVDGHAGRNGAARPASIAAAPGIRAAARLLIERVAESTAPWLAWCGAVWLAGAVVAAVRLGVGWSFGRRLVAEAVPLADGGWQARLCRWQTALGVPGRIRLVVSSRIDSPLVIGWLEPAVIWPLAAVTGMPPDQIDAILAHELAHIRRHDLVANLVQCCIEALFFHHPAAWWISGQVRAEREHCADELAVVALSAGRAGSRLSYATALVALEERRQRAMLAAAANGGSLTRRVERLVGIEPAACNPARLVAAILVLLAVGSSVAPLASGGRRAIAAPPAADAATSAAFPQDTNTIESLTPEQARRLTAEVSVRRVNIEIKGVGECEQKWLCLNGLKSLDAETAKELDGRYPGSGLFLDGLTTLSAEAATQLALHSYGLSLNGLTTLSDEAAEELSRSNGILCLNGLTTLSDKSVKTLADREGGLSLNGLTTLSAAAATALGRHKTRDGWGFCFLSLNGLTTLSTEAAKALAEHNGDVLSLNGLTELSDEAAHALAQHERRLALDGLTRLSDEASKMLAEHKGDSLSLNGLTTLSDEAAKAFAQRKQLPRLAGLTTLSDAAVKALAQHAETRKEGKRAFLALDRLTTLSDGAAQALAEHGVSDLSLNGLTSLSVEAARSLAKRTKELSLNGLTEISDEAVKALAQCKGDLSLNGLATLSDAAVEALARHTGGLSLNGLTTLSDEAVEVLARHKGYLDLDGVRSLSNAAAKALAAQKGGYLSLNGLTTLSDEAAESLAEHRGSSLYLNGLTELSDGAAAALAQDNGALLLNGLATLSDAAVEVLAGHNGSLSLNGLTTLSDEAARALARSKGHLLLQGVTTLSDEAAKVLAQHKHLSGLRKLAVAALSDEAVIALIDSELYDVVYYDWERRLRRWTVLSAEKATLLAATNNWDGNLPGLTTLSADAAKALARRKGSLGLNALTTISVEAAAALAPHTGGLSLGGLTTFDSPDSIRLAKVLATHKGPLSLPHLAKISPKTLSALIAKEDVQIPLIETLELIPEPDGSETDDFVVPKGFQQ